MPTHAHIVDGILSVDGRLDLLISQYHGNARLNSLLRGIYELADDELVTPLGRLEDMRSLDTAEGVWLDYIGRRLGFPRPRTDLTGITRFGFEGGDGVGFDQAPFATATGYIPQIGHSDVVYRLCLRVWTGVVLGNGTIDDMNAAVRRAFPSAYYLDNDDGTLDLVTGASGASQVSARTVLTDLDAFPRPAGIALTVT